MSWDAALGELRAVGWPGPGRPDGDDAELDGQDTITGRPAMPEETAALLYLASPRPSGPAGPSST
jgi:hypothetical protein